MLLQDPQLKVWFYNQVTDMRRQIDGLAALTQSKLQEPPSNGDLYVFVNRRRNLMKILYYSKGGYCLWSKRLEQGRFQSLSHESDKVLLDWTKLQCFIEGLDWQNMPKSKRYVRRDSVK